MHRVRSEIPEVHVPDLDKVIEDVISPQGVRRMHVIRYGSPVDVEKYKALAPKGIEPFFWCYQIGEEWHFHFAWKIEPGKEQ